VVFVAATAGPCVVAAANAGDDVGDGATAAAEISVEDVVVGTGPVPKPGEQVRCHYVLTLGGFEADGGRVVDSSRERRRPFRYTYGVGQVIKGWDNGLSSMHVGGRRRIIVPPSLGYGAGDVGPIPANSALYFDIELLTLNS
jgi:peptidylprolyl isomerase